MQKLMFLLLCFGAILDGCRLTREKKPDGPAPESPLRPAASPVFAYNLLAFGSVKLSSASIQGRLAAMEDAELSDYSVGSVLAEDKGRCDVDVGGDLVFKEGSVYQGKICAKGKMSTISVGTKFPGSSSAADFKALHQSALDLGSELSALPTTESVDDKYLNGGRGQITFEGTDPHLNIFTLDAALLSEANGIEAKVPEGASVVINVSGEDVKITDFNGIRGALTDAVLLNFHEAKSLEIERSNILGSVLAPSAGVKFQAGNITGSLVGASVESRARYLWKPYAGALTIAP